MGPVAVAALGAGAFVTTAAAGVVLLRRKFFGNAVEVDLEKGLEENAMERREGAGPGWKEYIEVDEKTSDLLVPLVGAFQSREEKDVTDANPFQALHTPELPLPALHQCPDLCTPTARQQIEPILVVEGNISETHYGVHAPAFPPGLPVPAKAVAVNRPISARSSPLLGLGPLDTGMTRITSWPVLAPTPVEEMRAKVNGQGVQVESDIKDDVVSQDVPATSGLESASDLEIAPNPGLPASSGLISESDEVDPFADPADSIHSPRSGASLDIEGSVSPICIPPSIANSLDDPDPQPGGVGWPDTTDSISATFNLRLCPSVAIPDTGFPVNIPLPESPPTSPKSVSPLLIHPLPPDTIATTTVTFGEELSLSEDVSDQDFSSRVIIVPTVPILAPIVITSYLEEGINEAPRSPLSDTSSSGSESWGPETPTELKQDLPFSPVLEISSKETPRLQLPVCLPSEEGMVVDEDIEVIDDFVMVGQQAPDPPSPTIDIIAPEWTASKLPGSFEVFTASTSSRASPGQKSAGAIALADVPPLTADMIQFCYALLAVSNCAGLVAQAVVGFSVWWSLTLVPA